MSSPLSYIPHKSLAILGMPGSGKSSVGRKLAARLSLPFFDADEEVEAAAGMSISQIFERFGEAEFRNGERRVIARLLEQPLHVLATGGGAFMDPETRNLIKERSLSIWLRADLSTLLDRTSRRTDRPLLRRGEPAEILSQLLTDRTSIYSQADVFVQSDNRPAEETVERVIAALHLYNNPGEKAGSSQALPLSIEE